MTPQNHAAWLTAKQDTAMSVEEAPYPSIGPDELIIRTKAIAINPADYLLQRTGILLTTYPAILGCDAAGIVQEVGSNLSSGFGAGDRVFGSASPLQNYKYAAFQEYVVLKAPSIARIPDGLEYKDAAVVPLGMYTSATGLFGSNMLNLVAPPDTTTTSKTLLVWGASGSVGVSALQLAVAAGYEVFAVAGSSNHGTLKDLGAAECFDYHESQVVAHIVQKLQQKERHVVGAFDAISKETTLHALCEILDQVGGRKFISSIMPGAEQYSKLGTEIKPNFTSDIDATGVTRRLWNDFLPAALSEGRYKCKPDAEVIGHGLGKIQEAVDTLANGVSAKKLVVTL